MVPRPAISGIKFNKFVEGRQLKRASLYCLHRVVQIVAHEIIGRVVDSSL